MEIPKLSPEYLAAKAADPLLAAPETMGVGARALTATLALPFRVARLADASQAGIRGAKPFVDPIAPSLPAPTSTGEALTDVAGQLAPYLVGAGLIGKGVSSVPGFATLASRSPVGATMVKDAAILGSLGASEGPAVGAEQAAEGLGYGALTALPRMWRVPLAAGIAGGSKVFFDSHAPDPIIGGMTRGDINAIVGGTLSLFPGRKLVMSPRPPVPDFFMPGGNPATPGHSPYFMPGGWARPSPTNFPPPVSPPLTRPPVPPGYVDDILAHRQVPNYGDPIIMGGPPGRPDAILDPLLPFSPRAALPAPNPVPRIGPELYDDILQRRVPAFDETIPMSGPQRIEPFSTEGMRVTEFVKATQELNAAIARGKLAEIEITLNNPLIKQHLEQRGLQLQAVEFLKRLRNQRIEKRQAIQNQAHLAQQNADPLLYSEAVNVMPPRGKLRELPEFRTTEGGGTFMDVIAPVARASTGAVLGAGLDEDDPARGAIAGAAIGLSPEFIRLLFRAAEAAPFRNVDNTGAIGNPPASVKPKPGGLKPLPSAGLADKRPDLAGYIMPELYRAMARSTVGGLSGGVAGAVAGPDENDPALNFLGGAALGALALGVGPSAARAVQRNLANTKVATAANSAKGFADMSGAALEPNPTASQRFVRWIDRGFEVTLPGVIKHAMNTAKGAASWLLTQTDDALMKISWRFNAPQGLKDITNEFLDMDNGITAPTYLQKVAAAFPDNDQAANYANLAVVGRETITGLQKMLMEGATPAQQKIIQASLGKYLTRSYKLFTHKNWEPDPVVVDRLATKILRSNAWPGSTFESIRAELGQVIREAKQNAGLYKQPIGSTPIGKMIAQKSFIPRKNLSKTYREFLGEVEDPTERIYQTIMRLRPMAEAGRYFNDLLTGVKEDGWLPHFFRTRAEKKAFEDALIARAANSPDDAARLAKYREVWRGHQTVQGHPRMGQLSEGIATRNVWDTLQNFDNVGNENAHPMMKSLMGIHTAIKLGRTVANPIQHVRQWVTSPMMMLIARSEVPDVAEAWKIMMNEGHAMRKEIMQMGIGNVDQVKGEFYNELKTVIGDKFNFGKFGSIDFDLMERAARRGGRNVMEVFRMPDNLVRISAYLSAKRRIAEQLGKKLDDPEVLEKAAAFTNRYTMNYDSIVPIAKGLRNKPFANLFISYLAEITRISKNLVSDVVLGGKGDGTTHSRLYAMLPLGMMAVIPEVLQSGAEAELSEKDRGDWEQAKKMMPEYMRHRFYANIKRDIKTGNFTYQDFTPIVVSDSLNQTVRAAISGDGRALVENNPVFGLDNTPVFNIIASQLMGMDRRTHREFRGKMFTPRNTADRVANIAKEVLPPITPGVGTEAQRFIQAYGVTESGEQGITNTRTGARITPSDFWQPYWTGVKGGSINLNVQMKRAVAKAKNEIANETAYMNDILRSDLNQTSKEEQVQHSLEAIAEIQEALRLVIQQP